MQRSLESHLLQWKNSDSKKPLLIRGARQVGKSYLIEHFGHKHFKNTVVINFELEPIYKSCFKTLDPINICLSITAISQQKISPGETLLFLDEIQDCPEALQALRYFKEKYPDLHVIGAGSLLELILEDAHFRMPVGRIFSYYMYPLSFDEYLLNFNPIIQQVIKNASTSQPPQEAIHQKCLNLLTRYLVTGGMPEPLAAFEKNNNALELQAIQSSIVDTYQTDFGHYGKFSKSEHLKICFNQIPIMIGQQIKYNKIDEAIRSRDLKEALHVLELASIFHRVHCSNASGIPFDANLNQKKFKLNFIDVGLVKRFNQLDAALLLREDIMLINKGALAEQFVGQELIAYSHPYEKAKLYFWARDGYSNAEVDYLSVVDSNIIPIEVKAGKTGKLQSLKQFMQDKKSILGIKISTQPLALENNILCLPLYMISELERIVRACLKSDF